MKKDLNSPHTITKNQFKILWLSIIGKPTVNSTDTVLTDHCSKRLKTALIKAEKSGSILAEKVF